MYALKLSGYLESNNYSVRIGIVDSMRSNRNK